MTKAEQDAKGQFVRTRHGATNNGVHSAKPRIITHQDDATSDMAKREKQKDWGLNYDERDMNEGTFRG